MNITESQKQVTESVIMRITCLREKSEKKLVEIVSRKLACSVTLDHWQKEKSGCETPIFKIPMEKNELAKSLSLSFTN